MNDYCYVRADNLRKLRQDRDWQKPQDWKSIEEGLRKDWSPEQVRGKQLEKGLKSPAVATIYRYIKDDKEQGGDLHRHLRKGHKPYKKRTGSKEKRGQIRHRKSIEKRPEIVDQKTRIGDWEADTVIGRIGGCVLVTLVDRMSRYTLMALSPSKEAHEIALAILTLLKSQLDKLHTITYDNGKEFAYHYLVNNVLKCESFFAYPYHSWERGLNENTNGLIRQYLPKGSSFDEISDEEIITIQNKLNSRPRKCLDYQSPDDIFLTN